jgi:hypothetical protein
MKPNAPEHIAHVVHGCAIGASTDKLYLISRFDLGNRSIPFIIPSAVVRWILDLPAAPRAPDSGCTIPAIQPDDWDGSKTPVMEGANITRMDDGLTMRPDVNQGLTETLLFNFANWTHFIDYIRQYESSLIFPQSAPSTKH